MCYNKNIGNQEVNSRWLAQPRRLAERTFMEVYEVKKEQLEVRHFESAKELADVIAKAVKERERAITWAADRKWVADALISPYEGYYTNVSEIYEGDFSEDEITEELKKRNLYIISVSGQSHYHLIYTVQLKEIALGVSYSPIGGRRDIF